VANSLGEDKMLAFVLSGGANRGPLEVGALQVLLERGVVPDMLVGTSAGAINAAFLAIDPSPDTARGLGHMWLAANDDRVFRRHRLTMLWRFLTGKDSLYSNEGFRCYVERSLPPGKERFADIQAVKLFIVATRLDTGEARVFGHDPQERLLDAIMASTALPPFFPPWACGDELLIDGGISADLPMRIAIPKVPRRSMRCIWWMHRRRIGNYVDCLASPSRLSTPFFLASSKRSCSSR
jgi:NTE family protein